MMDAQAENPMLGRMGALFFFFYSSLPLSLLHSPLWQAIGSMSKRQTKTKES